MNLKTATLIAFVFVTLFTGTRLWGFVEFLNIIERSGGIGGSTVNMANTANQVTGILAEGSLSLFLLALHARQRGQ